MSICSAFSHKYSNALFLSSQITAASNAALLLPFTPLDNRFHKIGDSADNDAKLYVAEEPTWHIGAEVTDDGR